MTRCQPFFRDDLKQEEEEEGEEGEEGEEERTHSLRNVVLLELDKFDKGNIDSDRHSSPEF
jgi:hypothetical protein